MATIRTKIITGVAVSLGVIATTAVTLRFWARRIKAAGYGLDDWTILAALVSALMMCIAAIIGSSAGLLGKHSIDAQGNRINSISELTIHNKSIWIISWNAALCPGITKIAVLLLYRRVFNICRAFSGRFLLYATWILLVLSISWTVTFFFANFFGCIPRETSWTFAIRFTCAKSGDMFMAMAVSSVIINALILALPSFPLSKLQMSFRRKLALIAIFALGGFTVVAGCLRAFFYWEAIYTRARDIQYDRAYSYLWSVIEACIGILSACLPCLGPIIRKKSLRSMLDPSASTVAPSSEAADSASRVHSNVEKSYSRSASSTQEHSTLVEQKGTEQLQIYQTTEWSLTRTDSAPPVPDLPSRRLFVPSDDHV